MFVSPTRLLLIVDKKYVFYCLESTEPSTYSIPFMYVQWMNEYTSVWIVNIYYNLAKYTFISLSIYFRLYTSLWFNETIFLFTNLVRENLNMF